MNVQMLTAVAPYHMVVWTAVNGQPRAAAPAAGADIDMISLGPASGSSASIVKGGTDAGQLAVPGMLVQVAAGAAFAADADLQTDGDGRAVPHAAGVAVLRSLEAAGAAGSIVHAVVKSGR